MAINTCETCGEPFYVEDGEGWKRLCLACWKRSKGQHWRPLGEAARLREELETTRLVLGVAELRIKQLEKQLARAVNADIDPAMLKLLTQLVHPDRHSGSAASNRATVYLNNLKRAKR